MTLNDYVENYKRNFGFFKDYSRESRFFDQLFQHHGSGVKRVVDIACGPGSHILELASMGYECAAADIDPDMLLLTRQAAQEKGVSIDTFEADMRDFSLDGCFDVAVNMFYAFQNVLFSKAEQLAFFQGVAGSLNAGGLFIIDLLPEENNLRLFPPGQRFSIHRDEQEDGTVLTVSSTNRIVDERVKEIVFLYETLHPNGESESREVISPICRVGMDAFHGLVSDSGLNVAGLYGDFDIESPFDDESSKLIAVLQKG